MRKFCVIIAAVAVLATSSCGWTKKKLGFAQTGPDETLVQTNDPLILPPEFSVRPKKTVSVEEDEEDDAYDKADE